MILEISLPGQLRPVRVAATQLAICSDNGTIVGLATAFGMEGGVQASVAGNADFRQMLAMLEIPRDRWPGVKPVEARNPTGIILEK